MTTPRIPPTEAELEQTLDAISSPNYDRKGVLTHPDTIRQLIAEIRRLRSLCGVAARHPWRVSQLVDARLRMQLEKAEEGEV